MSADHDRRFQFKGPFPVSVMAHGTRVLLLGGDVQLEINKEYVFKSAFTDEEFTGSYRGESHDGNIVVWTGKSQIYIPKQWANREATPAAPPAAAAGNDPDPFDMAQEERLWPSVECDDVTY
jgi:hypothetical protein